MEFYYDFAGFVYIMYSLHRKLPLMLYLVFQIKNRKELHHKTPILWNSSLLLVQSRPKAFKAIIAMDYRYFSVKSKVVISLFQTMMIWHSIFHCLWNRFITDKIPLISFYSISIS